MDDKTFNLIYVVLNIIEGFFWITLGLVLVKLAKVSASQKRVFSIFSICAFTLFGISDFVESQVGSFLLPNTMWLFVWKILCVIALLVIVYWYLHIRLISKHE